MKPVVALVGAFDRFNFGDLLFPQIVRWGLERRGVDADYRHFSLRAADLRPRGGVLTEPLTVIREAAMPPGSVVVVTGGEVLSARWLDAYHGLSGSGRALASKIAARLLGREVMDSLVRRRLAADRPLPWVIDEGDLGQDLPVLYNAVGGAGVSRFPAELRAAAQSRLEKAALVSVRDNDTQRALDGWDVSRHVQLSPDSGVLVGERYPNDLVKKDTSPALTAATQSLGRNYLVFQVGRYPAWGLLTELEAELRRIHTETGLGVLLLPLGQAPGHDDVVPLRRLAGRLRGLPVALMTSPDVSDILAAIAGAELFIGSSLHGNLTASAYGVPGVPFGSRVAKLAAVLHTWGSQGPVEVSDLATNALTSLTRGAASTTMGTQSVQDLANRNLDRIADAIG